MKSFYSFLFVSKYYLCTLPVVFLNKNIYYIAGRQTRKAQQLIKNFSSQDNLIMLPKDVQYCMKFVEKKPECVSYYNSKY